MIDWDGAVLGPLMSVFGQEGDEIVFLPAAGAEVALPGAVFNEHYVAIRFDREGNEVATVKPALGVRAALFASPPKQGDRIRFGSTGAEYVVANVEDDGLGHLNLVLNKARPR